LAGEHEVVQRPEQAEREVPVEIGSDGADPRIVREPAAELRVER
jgi:hypothetical protein